MTPGAVCILMAIGPLNQQLPVKNWEGGKVDFCVFFLFFLFFFLNLFVLAVLSLHCCKAFSLVGVSGSYSLDAVFWLLIAVASPGAGL